MLRCTARGLLFARLGRTKLGAEVLSKTRTEMRDVERTGGRLARFLARRRPIDYLALEVDGPVTKALHPSFVYVKHACTFLLMAPVLMLLLTGVLAPSYYLLVPPGFVTAEQYDRMWDFSHWGVVLTGQLILFLVLYDLSVYVRFPFFAYVLAPAYRQLGLLRPQLPTASRTLDELRRRPQAKPLGVPLSEARRAVQQQQQQHQRRQDPFGNRRRSQ